MVKADPPTPQIYQQEEAQAILQLAFARKAEDGELSRSQLLEIAAELGITPTELKVAESQWLANREECREKQEFNLYRQNRFRHRLVKYGIVNGFLIVLDFLATGGLSWSAYILLAWGLGLSLDAWKTYQTSGEEYDRAFSGWRLKQQVGRSLGNLANKFLNG
jgi:2TM domain